MQRDRRHISPAPGAGVQPRGGLLLSLSLAVLFAAADVCGDMTRQVAGRVSYAYAAGDAACSLQALLLSPSAPSPLRGVGWVRRAEPAARAGQPCRTGENRQGESSAADTAWQGGSGCPTVLIRGLL